MAPKAKHAQRGPAGVAKASSPLASPLRASSRHAGPAAPPVPQNILVLMHADLVPPGLDKRQLQAGTARKNPPWRTEFDVLQGLHSLGHRTRCLGVRDDLSVLAQALTEQPLDLCFNLLEEFHDHTGYGAAVISFLELMRCPYSGCNPRGTLLARDKALAKKLLCFHDIPTPRFAVLPLGRGTRHVGPLAYPLVVKAANEDASLGLSQASVVASPAKLAQRVRFMHEQYGVDVLVEEYIEGRELYVGILGNERLETLPTFELAFDRWPRGAPRIATQRVKWSAAYQARHAIDSVPARGLSARLQAKVQELALAVYRVLGLSGYGRIDFRLTDSGQLYVLEANPNPDIAVDGEFAQAARAAGWEYPELLQRILRLGQAFGPAWKRAQLESAI